MSLGPLFTVLGTAPVEVDIIEKKYFSKCEVIKLSVIHYFLCVLSGGFVYNARPQGNGCIWANSVLLLEGIGSSKKRRWQLKSHHLLAPSS